MPEEIMRLLEHLTNEDNKNPYTLSFERKVGEETKALEDVERDLSGLSEALENEKQIYNKVKQTAPEFKSSLKPLSKQEYVELIGLIGSQYNFEEISSNVEGSIAVFMEAKRELLENYKSQITALEVQRDSLSRDIIENQNKLNAQRKLREELIKLMNQAKEPESTITKAAVYSALKECFDEKGEAIFSEDDLDIAANMIMFPYNFPDLTENKTSVAAIIQGARDSLEEEPVLEQEPTINNQQTTIEKIQPPTVVEVKTVKKEEPVFGESNSAKLADVHGPWITEEDFTDIDRLLNELDLEEENEQTKMEQPEEKVQNPAEDIEHDEDPYDLIEELKKEEPTKDIKNDNFNENVKRLRGLGLPGDPHKYPVTLSEVTTEDIEKALELAKTYGVTIRTVGDVVKILSCNNVKESFQELIKAYADDYPQAIKTITPSKALSAYKPILGEKSYAIGEFFPGVIEELNSVSDNVYNPYGATIVMGLMGKLEKSLQRENNYAFSIADKSISIDAVSDALNKLTSSEKIMSELSDNDLMLIALTYDPKLSVLDVESIREELEQSLGEIRGVAA